MCWQIASGVNFRYNYFLKAGHESSFDVIWRPGPQFSLSVPSSAVNGDRKVIIRDSWMSVSAQSRDSYIWGSWIDDTCLLPNSVTSGQSEGDIFVAPLRSVSFHHLQNILKLKCFQWFGR